MTSPADVLRKATLSLTRAQVVVAANFLHDVAEAGISDAVVDALRAGCYREPPTFDGRSGARAMLHKLASELVSQAITLAEQEGK